MQSKGTRERPILLSDVARLIEAHATRELFGGKKPTIRQMADLTGVSRSTWFKLIGGGLNYEFSIFEIVADYLDKNYPVCDDEGFILPTDAEILAELDAEAKGSSELTVDEAVRKIRKKLGEIEDILKLMTLD